MQRLIAEEQGYPMRASPMCWRIIRFCITDRDGNFFIACLDEVPAAAGVMYSKDKKASLTFAATLPQYRNRGLHQCLLRRRVEEAVKNDCKLVISQCSFQSQSHKNMERLGMKIGYVRASWTERAAE